MHPVASHSSAIDLMFHQVCIDPILILMQAMTGWQCLRILNHNQKDTTAHFAAAAAAAAFCFCSQGLQSCPQL